MKYMILILIAAVVVLIAVQSFFLIYDARIEQQPYTVLHKAGNIELRQYQPALFASVTVGQQMFEGQNQAFRQLAAYIFGQNQRQERIAMTAPVHIRPSGPNSEMKFMIPAQYKREALPAPQNDQISFYTEQGYYALAIRFGGYCDQQKFEHYKNKLQAYLQTHQIRPAGDFLFLGYNAPFQWVLRRNEVLVKITYQSTTEPSDSR
ncbi:MAG: heme-binding protein [Bacteroidetes bacterium]|nr:MAG: heme-binding protein [Bacteroidota bacterium]